MMPITAMPMAKRTSGDGRRGSTTVGGLITEWLGHVPAVGEEAETIEDVYEPYLIQLGFLHRSPRGRIATEGAFDHFKVPRAARRRFGDAGDQPELF